MSIRRHIIAASFCFCQPLVPQVSWGQVRDKSLHEIDPRFKVDVDDGDEKPGDQAPSEESLNDLNTRELALSQGERRQPLTYSLGAGAGVAVPWQKYTLSFRAKAWEDGFHEVNLGSGDFIFDGVVQTRNYDLSINSQSLIYGLQYFIDDEAPIFITPLLGLAQWDGRIKPSGVDPAKDTLSSRLDTAFRAKGIMLGVNFGFLWTFENHWFVEYSIFRVGRAFLLDKSFTETSPDGERVIIRTLEHPLTWGVLNIKVGRFF